MDPWGVLRMNYRFKFNIPIKSEIPEHVTTLLTCESFDDILADERMMYDHGILLTQPRVYTILSNSSFGEIDGIWSWLSEGEIQFEDTITKWLEWLNPYVDAEVPTYLGYFYREDSLAPCLVFSDGSNMATFSSTMMVEDLLRKTGDLTYVTKFHDCIQREDRSLELVYERSKLFRLAGESEDASERASIILEL